MFQGIVNVSVNVSGHIEECCNPSEWISGIDD